MNSSNGLVYQMQRMSIDSSCSSFPSPPETLSSATDIHSYSSSSSDEFELDSSGFDGFTSSPSFASSANSLSSAEDNRLLSRSRCVHNLSALGRSSSSDSFGTMQPSSGPNKGWGYFVDTPAAT
ncbi:hypothetical protein ACHAWF_001339 [Thalassiosira exigua]